MNELTELWETERGTDFGRNRAVMGPNPSTTLYIALAYGRLARGTGSGARRLLPRRSQGNETPWRSLSAAESAVPQKETEKTPGRVSRDNNRGAAAVHPPLTAADRRAVARLVTEDDTPVDNRFSQ